jgi:hypothetical protein
MRARGVSGPPRRRTTAKSRWPLDARGKSAPQRTGLSLEARRIYRHVGDAGLPPPTSRHSDWQRASRSRSARLPVFLLPQGAAPVARVEVSGEPGRTCTWFPLPASGTAHETDRVEFAYLERDGRRAPAARLRTTTVAPARRRPVSGLSSFVLDASGSRRADRGAQCLRSGRTLQGPAPDFSRAGFALQRPATDLAHWHANSGARRALESTCATDEAAP